MVNKLVCVSVKKFKLPTKYGKNSLPLPLPFMSENDVSERKVL